jgi:hypothetical protein
MSIGPIANLAGGYLQSIISPALRSAGLTSTTTTSNSTSGASASQPDNGQLSPFAQLLNTLQELQQSNPSQYGQVTQQIATNLQSAAQTAQANGNTTAAGELNTLATDFTSASQSGQLPNVQDLAKALGGGHHHHHAHAASGDSDGGTNSSGGASPSSSAANSASQMMSQLLASFQSNVSQSASADPASIIMNTLSNAGVGGINA